jgi:hypothetical protein
MAPRRGARGQAASQERDAEETPEAQAGPAGPSVEEEGDIEEGGSQLRSARNTPAPSEEEEEDALREAMAEREARRKRVLLRRIQAENESLRIEEEGGTPATFVEIEGAQLPSRKRAATSQAGAPSQKRHIQLAPPPTFDGRSLNGLHRYNMGWQTLFRAMDPIAEDDHQEHEHRIQSAATHLTELALAAWARQNLTFTRWEDYVAWLRTIVSDPATRKSDALLSLAAKKQRTGQSVRELLAEIEGLEEDIPPMTEEERKAWTLLNALSPALRAEVMREHKDITSREQILASAQRHEEVSKQRLAAESIKANKQPTPKRFPGGTLPVRGGKAPQAREDPATPRDKRKPTTKTDFRGTCFNCGGEGHKEAECRKPKRTRDASAEPKKSKGKSKN